MLHTRGSDTPDSPFTESADDWSSFAEIGSDEEHTQFIMPRPTSLEIVPHVPPPTTGKLRVLVLGGLQSGKSEFIKALPYTQLLGSPSINHLAHGLVANDFAVAATEPNISFVDGASPEYIQSKLVETAQLVNGAHPMAVALLAQATALDPFPLVDCAIYLFDSENITNADLVVLRQVAAQIPTIPVLSKCDAVGGVDLFERRVRIKRTLENLGLQMFYFEKQALPYAISSHTFPNWDMSLSVVEHEGYASQQLVQSQMSELVESLLGAAAELRHHAALGFSQSISALSTHTQPQFRLELSNVLSSLTTAPTATSKMRPIRNIDPLDVGRWAQTLGFITVFLTLAGSVALAPETAVY